MTDPRPITYKDAGVDIASQDAALAKAKASVRSTYTPGVMSEMGLFGGLFDLAKVGADGHILVASADGVGTKLEVAARAQVYDGVGRDLVQHCINDILVQGARPLFFMDYVGTGKLDPDVVADLVKGCADACRDNGLALLGGETAEMPGLYKDGDFDLVGFIVGSVARDRVLDGSRVRPGQTLIGLPSSGLHTNGYSLARKVIFERLGLGIDDRPEALGGRTVAEALLAPHRSYLELLWPLLEEQRLAGMAHITGGGLVDNVPRILGGGTDALIDLASWKVPGLFRMIVEAAGIDRDEAYQALNMGIGMVLFVDETERAAVERHLSAEGEAWVTLGTTIEAREPGEGRVRWA